MAETSGRDITWAQAQTAMDEAVSVFDVLAGEATWEDLHERRLAS